MELSGAYDFINNFGELDSPINSSSVQQDPLTGEVTTQFNLIVNLVPFNWVEIKITGTPGIETNDPINVDPYVLAAEDPVRSRLDGIPVVAFLKMEQIKIIGNGEVVNNAVEGFTHFEVPILYEFRYGVDFGIEVYFPWESIVICTMNNFTGEGVQIRTQ